MNADFSSMPIVGKWFTHKGDFCRVGSLNPRGRFTHYGMNIKSTERGKPCVERWVASCKDRARGFKNPRYLAKAHPTSYNKVNMSNYRRADATGATFFFTVTLANRQSDLLVTEVARLKQAFNLTAATAPFETVAICVLPDHLHCIWQLPEGDANYPQRWSAIKARFSRGLNAIQTRSASKVAKREKGIWQRRYWEHQIRDESDLQRHVDYIHMNPIKHGLVAQVRDWPHSSFHRYVKKGNLPADWGGIDNGFTVPE